MLLMLASMADGDLTPQTVRLDTEAESRRVDAATMCSNVASRYHNSAPVNNLKVGSRLDTSTSSLFTLCYTLL